MRQSGNERAANRSCKSFFSRPLLAVARHAGREPFTAADRCRGKGGPIRPRCICLLELVSASVNLTSHSGNQKVKQTYRHKRPLCPATVRGAQITVCLSRRVSGSERAANISCKEVFSRPLPSVARHAGREPFTAADRCRGQGAPGIAVPASRLQITPHDIGATQKWKTTCAQAALVPRNGPRGANHRLPFTSSER